MRGSAWPFLLSAAMLASGAMACGAGRVTTTLPSGYRVTTYHGRPYYAYGGAYYRPYVYGGIAYSQAASGGPAAADAAPAPPIRSVAETLTVPSGTVVLVRLQADVSSATAKLGDRFQGFLDQDLAADGRLIVGKGARVYGAVTAVDAAVIPAQTLESFTVAVPFQVQIMTNVAVR